jgi:hypothetical protein
MPTSPSVDFGIQVKDWADLSAKIVKNGQSSGEINPEIDPHSVANLVISMLERATLIARIDKRSAAFDDAQRHLSLYPETALRFRSDSGDGNLAV